MTETSLVPELAGDAGISFDELVRWMVEDASLNR
jgi:D-alanine-D-alanine ligase